MKGIVVLFSEQACEAVREAGADPYPQGAPPELLHGFEAAATAEQDTVWCDRDRLEQTKALDGGHQRSEVSHVGSMPRADHDRVDASLEFDVTGLVRHGCPC